MATLEQESEQVVEIDDIDHIATVVEGLDSRMHALSIALLDTGLDYPAELGEIDRHSNLLALSITDAQSLEPADLKGHSLVLRAEDDRSLAFDSMTITAAERDQDRLILRCTLPRRLRAAARRDSARIALRDDMPVPARLTRFTDQSPLKALLSDISLGGCLLKMPLSACAGLRENDVMPELALIFPDGTRLETPVRIRHINPVGRSSQAAVGLAFMEKNRQFTQQIMAIVASTEREVVWRRGESVRLATPTELYTPRNEGRRQLKRQPRQQDAPPMLDRLKTIARELNLFLLALQNARPLPVRRLAVSAVQLLKLLRQNRQQCFYALECLRDQPVWLQHSLSVAARLADLALTEPDHVGNVQRLIMAAMIHDMGKVLLVDQHLPSLESDMTAKQRQRIRDHVATLVDALERNGYPLCAQQHGIISTINERLDGSGYPAGLHADALSPLTRMASVVDTLDAMTRRRGDRDAMTASEAYRRLYQQPQRFDRHWLTRYIQRHGFYPVASLVKFSNGYLAWVISLDERAQPDRVRVVRNTQRRDLVLNDEIGRHDFYQLGRLVCSVSPAQYGL